MVLLVSVAFMLKMFHYVSFTIFVTMVIFAILVKVWGHTNNLACKILLISKLQKNHKDIHLNISLGARFPG